MAASNPFQRELCAVALLGAGVFLGVSLATYSPSDPVSGSLGPLDSVYRPDVVEYPAPEEVANSCGRWGAVASDLLLTGIGAGAYYTVGSLLVLSGFLFMRAGLEGPLFRLVGWLGSVVGISTLAALLFPEWSPGPMIGSGGYLGALGAGLLLHHFALFGSLLLAGSFVVGGLLMCSDQIFPAMLRWTLGGFLAPLLKRQETVVARVDAGGRPLRTPNKSPPVKIAPAKSRREKAAAAAAAAAAETAVVAGAVPRGGAGAGSRADDDSSPSILPIRGRGKGGAAAIDDEDADELDQDFVDANRPSRNAAADAPARGASGRGNGMKNGAASGSAGGATGGATGGRTNGKTGGATGGATGGKTARGGRHVEREGDGDAERERSEDHEGDDERTANAAGGNNAPGPHFKSRSSHDARSSVLAELQEDERVAAVDDYQLPGLELLVAGEDIDWESQEKEVRRKAKVLEKTFADFGFKVRVVEIETGPVIAQYEVELEAGLRLSKITALADDLAIALRVPSVRIVAPIPGKNTVGIEVPNEERQVVRLREVIEETNGKIKKMRIPLFLGKDVSGNPLAVDLSTLPHLLIAGRTGTGKSVCLNAIISSILMTRRPDEVRMIMIDPKMVELSGYGRLPHLMHPVVTDMKKAEAILAWGVEKMEERYALLARAGVRHISNYNQLGEEELRRRLQPEDDAAWASIPKQLPFIVIVADEIADMMMTAGKEVEQHIIRLAQKSRAVGIHLILATQKPTVDVITGLIKSNLPARISFQVASRVDSRVVLDEMGADKLLGNGDMLFLWPGTSTLLRGQGTYLGDDEITRLVDCCSRGRPQNFVSELVNMKVESDDADEGGLMEKLRKRDELYESAVDVVIREGRGSCSLLQRALGIGYGRAARLIDFMAEDGIVGTYAGSQAREVLMTVEQWEQLQNESSGEVEESGGRRTNRAVEPAGASASLASQTSSSTPSAWPSEGLGATGTTGPAPSASPKLVPASGGVPNRPGSAIATATSTATATGRDNGRTVSTPSSPPGVAFAPPSALDEFIPDAPVGYGAGEMRASSSASGFAPAFSPQAGVPPRVPLAGNLPPAVALAGVRAPVDSERSGSRHVLQLEDGASLDEALEEADEWENELQSEDDALTQEPDSHRHGSSTHPVSSSPASTISKAKPTIAAEPSPSISAGRMAGTGVIGGEGVTGPAAIAADVATIGSGAAGAASADGISTGATSTGAASAAAASAAAASAAAASAAAASAATASAAAAAAGGSSTGAAITAAEKAAHAAAAAVGTDNRGRSGAARRGVITFPRLVHPETMDDDNGT